MSSRPKVGPMGGGPGPGNIGVKGPKPKNFWKTVKRLFRYMSKRMLSIIAVLVLAIAAVIFQIQTPKVLGQATTEIFKGVMTGAPQMQQGQQVTTFPIDFDKIAQIISDCNRDVSDFCCLQLLAAIYYDTCFTANSL